MNTLPHDVQADGGDGAMWRALEQSGNVAAVVAVLATATVRLRSTSQVGLRNFLNPNPEISHSAID